MRITHIDGTTSEINIVSEKAKQHFVDPHNYTKEILEEWESLPYKGFITKEDKIILDIGANVGLFALHVMPLIGKVGRIICVEPTPEHMEIQKELLSIYSSYRDSGMFKISPPGVWLRDIQHEQSALNSYTGKAKFHHEPVNTTMNTLRDDGYEVDCITLYDLCKKYNLTHVDFCKVDIEGSEWVAITKETLIPVRHIIDKFFLETHPRSRESMEHFKAVFESAGYKTKFVDFNGSVFAYK